MLFKIKLVYGHWLKLYKKIGKPERFGIGDKINNLFIELIEIAYEIRFTSPLQKLPHLNKAITQIDKMKLFAEIGWENRMILTKEYSEFLHKLEEIGRELGGWKKGILNKNSQSQ